jgi:NAD(P)-dependent dehydrogenase (short-subunit alcohol dehydrogenase family)
MIKAPKKTIVITGASTGIGEACARRFAMLGHRVYAGVRREEDGVRLSDGGNGNLVPLMLDVESESALQAAVDTVARAAGDEGVFALINNAGVAISGPMECVPLAEVRRQFDINVFGALAVTQAFLPMLRRAAGRIVMMSSISGRITGPFLGPYSASKFALEAISDALRLELRPWGISVSIIEPGPIATPIWDKSTQTARRLREAMPPACRELYNRNLDKLESAVENAARSAIPCSAVVASVEHALFSQRPKTRYLIGRQTRMAALLTRFMPDRLRDRLILKSYDMLD